MLKPHLEILDARRQEVFKMLSVFKDVGYLAGGTALALQIAHRKSVDFDVFINNPVDNSLRQKSRRVFGKINFYKNNEDQISFYIDREISVTFYWSGYSLLNPQIETDSIGLASLEDIAASKAYTIGRRVTWRDYVDIFFLIRSKILTLEQIIKLAGKKYPEEFNELLFFEQIIDFKSLSRPPIAYINYKPTDEEIEKLLKDELDYYLKKNYK